jgi:hypothetical protein
MKGKKLIYAIGIILLLSTSLLFFTCDFIFDLLPKCTDNDGDGYGKNCDLGDDCNDNDAAINPGATEVCDGVDNNCNGEIDEGCECINGETRPCGTDEGECVAGTQTCIDGAWGECEGSVGPSDEICDGLDNDCDGETDEGCECINGETRPCGTDEGECVAGTQTCIDGAWGECEGSVGPAEEVCDGLDNDCDGVVDPEDSTGCTHYYYDYDEDGFGVGALVKCLCAPEGLYRATRTGDCNDENPAVNPDAREACDSIDNNCNGVIDEEGANGCRNYYIDADGDTFGTGSPRCFCSPTGNYTATRGGDCNDADSSMNPAVSERCDGKDNDCDGSTDEEGAAGCRTYYRDNDGDGYGTSSSRCLCNPSGSYRATQSGDCDDTSSSIYPGATETCNGDDDNCNGTIDDVNMNNNNSSIIALSDIEGDVHDWLGGTRCQTGPTHTSRGEAWFRIKVLERSSWCSDVRIWVKLEVPSNMNYDLYLYRNSTSTLVDSSTGGNGVTEVVRGNVGDHCFPSEEDTDTYYIEVRYRGTSGGNTCSNWRLRTYGGCSSQP